MGKKRVRENFRVEVIPREPSFGVFSEHQAVAECERIKSEIKRHVDAYGAVGTICDDKDVCEFCNSKWTEDGDYNGGCCEADMDAEEARQAERGAA